MRPHVLMKDGIINHQFIVTQDDKSNGSLENEKKERKKRLLYSNWQPNLALGEFQRQLNAQIVTDA